MKNYTEWLHRDENIFSCKWRLGGDRLPVASWTHPVVAQPLDHPLYRKR
jgi:hypothetical protein